MVRINEEGESGVIEKGGNVTTSEASRSGVALWMSLHSAKKRPWLP
jgi:hypothetical protein